MQALTLINEHVLQAIQHIDPYSTVHDKDKAFLKGIQEMTSKMKEAVLQDAVELRQAKQLDETLAGYAVKARSLKLSRPFQAFLRGWVEVLRLPLSMCKLMESVLKALGGESAAMHNLRRNSAAGLSKRMQDNAVLWQSSTQNPNAGVRKATVARRVRDELRKSIETLRFEQYSPRRCIQIGPRSRL
jgi:hypothetical protein